MQKLDAKAFALAGGILWALGVVFIDITSVVWNWGTEWAKLLSSFYLGYGPNFLGVITGAIWAFFDAFIDCFIFAWLYNKFAK